MAIKAPFNFVPLNEQVFFPEWAGQISHDIPFSDAVSGILNLTIEAASPIFVGEPGKDERSKEFCHTEDGRYFIPATTLKGAFRNVLEIISYGKMTQAQNQSFGIRDLNDKKFYIDKVVKGDIHCGWLWQEDGSYYLDDCGKPWRISAEALDHKYGCGLEDFIKNRANFKSDIYRTAKKKYELFEGVSLHAYFEEDFELKSGKLAVGGREFVRFSPSGSGGTIVFTGQPGVRARSRRKKDGTMGWQGKFFEFVFPDEVEKGGIAVPDYTIHEFESVHQNSPDFEKFRETQLNRGERIPVFFLYSGEGKIDSIGLSYMHKFPAAHSVHSAIPQDLLRTDQHDLAECMFGYTGKEKSLKGRVQFSHAFLQGEPVFVDKRDVALSTPHPSYYPLYLGNGQTWNSDGVVRIAGRKRYPVRNSIFHNEATDGMTSYIQPLQTGALFKGRIRFHNLRPIELGALLAAITFCGNDKCYHSIGMGKPLGYGKSRVTVDLDTLQSVRTKDYSKIGLMDMFKECMEKNFPGWTSSAQLRELMAMAIGIQEGREDEFKYMKMSTDRNENDFLKGKKDYESGEQLGLFTQILDYNVPKSTIIGSISADKQRVSFEAAMQAEEEKTRQRKAEVESKCLEAEQLIADGQYKECERFLKEVETTYPEIKPIAKTLQEKITICRGLAASIAEEADKAMGIKNFLLAIQKYKEAQDYGFDDYSSKINLCELELQNLERMGASDIDSFLKEVAVASIPAFANQLKKRHNTVPVTPSDYQAIAARICSKLPSLKKKDQKKWTDRQSWKPIEEVLGQEAVDAITSLIKI